MERIKQFVGLNLDFMGSLAAMICAVHCMAMPLLLSIGLVSGTGHNHTFDIVFLLIGFGIAIYVLIKDFFVHKNAIPLCVAIFGFTLLTVGIFSHSHFILNILGGLLITVSHYINWKQVH